MFSNLKDTVTNCNVTMYGLFFYHLYSDLTTLVKSNKLNKSVMDMNVHYLELHTFWKKLLLI